MGTMRTPIRPVPDGVARWVVWARALRWLDALVAWPLSGAVVSLAASQAFAGSEVSAAALASLAAVPVVVLALVAPVRRWWRPVSGAVGLRLSRTLGPGDRAWYIRPGAAELVVVTSRRGARVTIAARGGAEGIRVRRTRVLLVPADAARRS
jgi:hypothetical protein